MRVALRLENEAIHLPVGLAAQDKRAAMPVCGLARGSRRLHCGQSRREGPRNSAGRPAPGKQCRRGSRERSTGMGLRGPHAGASTSGARGAAALGPAPINAATNLTPVFEQRAGRFGWATMAAFQRRRYGSLSSFADV